jgi:hypothetical protein
MENGYGEWSRDEQTAHEVLTKSQRIGWRPRITLETSHRNEAGGRKTWPNRTTLVSKESHVAQAHRGKQ